MKVLTYEIVKGDRAKLEEAAKMACNFWNRFVEPETDIVLQLGTRWRLFSKTTAWAFNPWSHNGIKYGRVDLNSKFLNRSTAREVAQTLAHEIGHTLGFGYERWNEIVDMSTGRFRSMAVERVPALAQMSVQLSGPAGVKNSHWAESAFSDELMTPYKNGAERVFPVTIDVMELLGHRVKERLSEPAKLDELLASLPPVSGDFGEVVAHINKRYAETTAVFETLPQ